MKKTVIISIILDILAIIFLFFTYGPISYFRNLLITTSMTTMTHKYLARTLYSDKTINKVLNNNYVKEVNENTNSDLIDFTGMKEPDKYESIYEEQILKRDKDDLYKLIPISGSGYKGYIVAIYDPKTIGLETTAYMGQRGEFLSLMHKRSPFKVGINAGGFADAGGVGSGGIPTGTVIKDSKIVYRGADTGWTGGLIGFNKDNVLVLTKETPEQAIKNGMQNAVEFGPFLIVNGKRSITKGNGGWGLSSRTAIAQRKDGIVLFVIIDGRQPGYSIGINMADLTDLLVRYKAYNAANLDGGASTDLVINGKIINKPCANSANGERWLPNAWVVR